MLEEERVRLHEVVFWNFIIALMKKNSNPIRIYDFIECMAQFSGCNVTVLNSVISVILANDRRYMPIRYEYVYLLIRAGVPVRYICKFSGMSQTTYYKIKDETTLIVKPKFNKEQYREMMKFMKAFINFVEPLERGLLKK